jgi:S1-C subfamily serine protease
MNTRFVRLLAGSLICAPPAAFAQKAPECRAGEQPAATLGIAALRCTTATCTIARNGDVFAYDLTVEPTITDVDARGPSAGVLRRGDVVVAVGGDLVTTRAGGSRLANPPIGQPLDLRIRRGGVEQRVRITPAPACVQAEADGPKASFGVELECGTCDWRKDTDGRWMWQTFVWPIVVSVDPGSGAARAGLRNGDMLLTIDGRSLIGREGWRYVATLEPGQRVVVELRDGRRTRRVVVTLDPTPERQ